MIRRKTMHDVAKLSGVSYQTVSRVINNHPYVADDTRQRVLEAIEQLGYRPNRAAQSLAGRRTRALGMTVFGIDYYGPAQMMINIEAAAREAGYDLIFANVPKTTTDELSEAINHLLHWELDGFLFLTPLVGIDYAELQDMTGGKPMVLIGAPAPRGISSVSVDQQHGGKLAAYHLLELGHQRIAEIRGPWDWIDAKERHNSFSDVLALADHPLVASELGDWTPQSGYDATMRLLDSGLDVTALAVGNDQMAVGVLRALAERGVRVPDEMSVIGFDDIPEARFFSPPLTTIRQEFDIIGKMAIAYLMDNLLMAESTVQQMSLAPRLVVRQSTAAPRR